jgi:hypothetical protein
MNPLPARLTHEHDDNKQTFGIRKFHRPLPCIIEHIKPDPAEMTKTKAWVEKQMGS